VHKKLSRRLAIGSLRLHTRVQNTHKVTAFWYHRFTADVQVAVTEVKFSHTVGLLISRHTLSAKALCFNTSSPLV
jgi:hypothetical protein